MIIYPSIDLMDGRGVQLVQGIREQKKLEFDALEKAREWKKTGAKHLHVIDLDAVFTDKRDNMGLIGKIIREFGGKVQVGGGVRDELRVKSLIDIGASSVITGTKGVLDRVWLKRVSQQYPGKIIQSVDALGTQMVIRGWTEKANVDLIDYSRAIQPLGLAGLLYTNVQVEGLCEGIDIAPVKKLIRAVDLPIIVSGGITTTADVKALKDAGASGVVVGMALYTGKIKFKDAVEACG